MSARALPRLEPDAPAGFPLVELRRYRAKPGRRDDLIDMFERTFLDAYEAAGALIPGTFRDLDDADRWTWMRAFRDGESRGEALTAFYASDVWKDGARACNATIAETGAGVLLRAASGLAAADASHSARSVIALSLYTPRDGDAFASFHDTILAPVLRDLGAAPFATLVTDRNENTYPRQRVRRRAAVVTLTRFASPKAYDAFISARAASRAWAGLTPQLARLLTGAVETRRLAPTARSRLR